MSIHGASRQWLRLLGGLLVLVWLGSWGCGAPDKWSFPDTGSDCDIIAKLRDDKGYQTASSYDDPGRSKEYDTTPTLRNPYRGLFADTTEYGCMILFHTDAPGQPTVVQTSPFALTNRGTINGLNETTGEYNASIKWSLPQDLKEKTLELRFYVLRPGLFKRETHVAMCKDLFQNGFPNCFPTNASEQDKQACWFYMQLKPNTAADSPFQFNLPADKTCRLCHREICGNKIDDDCDGTPDNGCEDTTCHHPGATLPCYTEPANTRNKGLCKEGTKTCVANAKVPGTYIWGECKGQVGPISETCNGLDDDCDGQTDEDLPGCCLVGSQKECTNVGACDTKFETCRYDATSKQGTWDGCKTGNTPAEDTCNGKDDDCDGQVDEDHKETDCTIPNGNGHCKNGKDVCLADGTVACIFKGEPKNEVCNGQDDDCDGQTDEQFPEFGQTCTIPNTQGPCATGFWSACTNGQKVCTPTRKAEKTELCGDGIDNDCNGKIDDADSACQCKPGTSRACYPGDPKTKGVGRCQEGSQTCELTGQWGECQRAVVPTTEICNGLDDDCDGQTDESFPGQGKQCPTFLQGPCGFGRLQKCGKQSEAYRPVCSPVFTANSKEICHNGIDDNCNGVIDEFPTCKCNPNTQPSQKCSQAPSGLATKGSCKQGTMACGTNGVWGGCVGDVTPIEETCDGKDNDCNGQVDEYDSGAGVFCNVNGKKGVCNAGTTTCKNGRLVCNSNVQPAANDLCNGQDDDCDGQTDESDPQSGKPCAVPNSKGECAKGTLTCTGGKWTCKPSKTTSKETCNGLDDDCNGTIDDNLKAPDCTTPKQGLCQNAKQYCAGSLGWIDCNDNVYYRRDNQYQSAESRCDGTDNDCDGQVDNQPGTSTPLEKSCYASPSGTKGPDNTVGIGICRSGTQSCNNGQWEACQKAILPQTPLCDGTNTDSDCNGIPDQNEPACSCWGTGKDGSIVITGNVILDETKGSDLDRTPASKRQLPDMVSYVVDSLKDKTITLTKTAAGLDKGDEILLIHVQGDTKRVGSYELFYVADTPSGKELKITRTPSKTYGETDNTSLAGQRVLVIRVPHYKRVTVRAGGTLTARNWNGTEGGILVFRAQELVRVEMGGTLQVNGKGFRGGTGVTGNSSPPRAGESPNGWPTDSTGTNGGGGGAPHGVDGASGGGGGYGTAGAAGKTAKEENGSTGGTSYKPNNGELTDQLRLGSGGGAGGGNSTDLGKSTENISGNGGAGGGVIFILSPTINLSGTFSANGDNATDGKTQAGKVGGGGGGAGGSVFLQTDQLVVYQGGTISAIGGKGGTAAESTTNGQALIKVATGGTGGVGIIDIRLQSYLGSNQNLQEALKQSVTPEPASQALPASCRATSK